MPNTNDVETDCGKQIVNGVDFLARHYDLRETPVDLETRIGEIGLGDNDCAIFERYINKRRKLAGKPKLNSGTIRPTTTIQELIDDAC